MCGGHKAVMSEIMEDVALGRVFRQNGLPMNCLAGRGTIAFRMYPDGIRQMIEGWSKNFASGAKASHLSLLLLVIVWVTGALQAVINLAALPLQDSMDHLAVACVPYAAYALQIHWMLRRLGNYGFFTAVLFPVPLLFFVSVFAYSLVITFVVRRVRWRGRSIALHKTVGHT
jgi:4,4'-diaponeurosporenoate glycosyltransferase